MPEFETKVGKTGRIWHRHGMPDAAQIATGPATIARIYGPESGWHWESDHHALDGVSHGYKIWSLSERE